VTSIVAEADLLSWLHVESESGYQFAYHFVPDDRTIAMIMMMVVVVVVVTFRTAEYILYVISNIHRVLTLI
jgi:hypothetical protein